MGDLKDDGLSKVPVSISMSGGRVIEGKMVGHWLPLAEVIIKQQYMFIH